jgi:hemoglobin-like flavoprotein
MSPTSVPETTTSLDVDLIQSTYSTIKSQADEFAESFYQILFEKYPNVKPLFLETDMKKQKDKLMESLDLVLVNVHNIKAFKSILKDLGKRHVKYGAVLTDYPLVGDALLQALEKHLGEDWNPNVKHAWTLAYQSIADTMAEGAKSVSKNNSTPEVRVKINSEDNKQSKQHSSSNNRFVFNKVFAIACLGITAISGYAIWTLMQPQSNAPLNPTGVSRTN